MEELMRSLAYSIAGLVVGFFLGTTYTQRRLRRTMEEHPVLDPKNWEKDRFLGFALIVMAVITTALSAMASYQAQDQAKCFTSYNAEFVDAYIARAKAADKDRTSFNNLVVALNTPDQAARTRAFTEYVEQVKATDTERKQNPIPDPPNPNKYCERR